MTLKNTLIIFDFNRTLFDPEEGSLIPGAHETLTHLQNAGATLYLVSRLEPGRAGVVERLGLDSYFAGTTFVEEKSAELFEDILQKHPVPRERVYVVGDHLHGEIRHGNMCLFRTIWLKRGKFQTLTPEVPEDVPWRTVTNLIETLTHIT
jgi:FMN phosphatase YigB (HAD superfamily)